jgi:uncharacterized delta-60 repeat protein
MARAARCLARFFLSRARSTPSRKSRPAAPPARLAVELLEARTLLSGGPALQVSIAPHSIVESTGPASSATGTVTRVNTDNSQPLTVNLNSSNSAEATVPTSVVIPANQASATFAVQAVADAAADGTQNVTVTGTARVAVPLGLDASFGGTGSVAQSSITQAVALQSDGKVVTAGLRYNGGNSNFYDFAVSRYNADGTPDTSFGGTGTVFTDVSGQSDRPLAVVIQPDGKIVVGGTGGDGPHLFWVLARYNPDGSLDGSFGNGGKVVTNPNPSGDYNEIWDLALQADGKILAAGDMDQTAGSSVDGNFAVARYNTNGTLDTNFGVGGIATSNPTPGYSDRAFGVVVQPADGKIVLAGGSKGGNFDSHFALSRFTAAGVLDPSFGGTGTVFTDVPGSYEEAQDVALQPNGQLVVAGYVSPAGVFPPVYNFALARYNANGSLDTNFGTGGVTVTDFGGSDQAEEVALLPDGRIAVVGGGVGTTLQTSRVVVALYNPNGTLITSAVSANSNVQGQDLAVQSDGRVVVASSQLTQFGGFVERYADFAIISGSDTVAVQDDTAPVANNDSYSVNEDSSLAVAAPGVLGNDTDADGDSLTAKLVSGPAHGSLALNADGSFSYTPTALYSGPDSFTYQANDGLLDSNVATVAITVNHVNHAPVASNDSYSVNEDGSLTVAAPGVLGNDTDVDGDPLTARLVSGPAHGALALNADGSFSYTPAALYSGPDTFTYTASDGAADSNVATVAITVNHVNHAPVATNDSYSVNEGSSLSVPAPGVLGNDTDVDGDPLTARLVSGPSHGSLALNADGSFTYTPAAFYSGPDSFTYRANDGTADSNVATVAITVNQVNHAPVANSDSYSVNAGQTLTVAAPGVLGNDTDVDGDHLTAVLAGGPADGSLTLQADGSFSYTPAAGFSGTDQFSYRDFDGTTTGNAAVVTITVNPLQATEGKVTGGGSFDGGTRKFNLDAQAKSHGAGLDFSGALRFEDRQAGIVLQSTAITFLRVEADGIHATISGTATVNGVRGYTFTVTVEDRGEPGVGADRFRIRITGPGGFSYDSNDFSPRGGLLDEGNIQVHKKP